MKKNTKIIVILIVAVLIASVLILPSAAFIWRSDNVPIIPDGYTELEGSYRLAKWDGYPPYDVRPLMTVCYPAGYTPPTSKGLMKGSDLVVAGRVLSFSESKWSTPDGQKPEGVLATSTFDENGKFLSIHISSPKMDEYIYTDMDVQVDAIYKGELDSEIITIRLQSGTVGEYCMSNDGGFDVQRYNESDDIFLFLKYNKADGVYYLPTSQCAYIKM